MSDPQCTADVLMIRPAGFGANEQTAASNRFQQGMPLGIDARQAALAEFDAVVAALRNAGVRVHLFDDTASPRKPDALFPNNWVSFHADGTIVLYPMLAPNRRAERRLDILESLARLGAFHVNRVIDLGPRENDGLFLEGTGSLVLDRTHRIAYACLSPRTSVRLLGEFGQLLDYEVVAFEASDPLGHPIYHTNVMMNVGERYAAICMQAVREDQRAGILDALRSTGHRVIELSFEQVGAFAGNALELDTDSDRHIVCMSQRALESLTVEQREELAVLGGPLVAVPIPTIETLGGGSLRCMVAEIHLPEHLNRSAAR